MAKKERYPDGYYRPSIRAAGDSEGCDGSGCSDTEMTASEDSSAPVRKCINLNSNRFGVPIQVHPLSKMSRSERKDLVCRLRDEIELIRNCQKKLASRRTSAAALSSSSDILSCNSVPSMLSSEEAKKAIVPGKRPRCWNLNSSGKFEPAEQGPAASNSNAMIMKQCMTLLRRLLSHEYAWVFKEPVDVVKLNIPDYLTIIKHPMDLGTIKKKLGSKAYSGPRDFLADVRLTFSNAMTYNPPGNNVHAMAKTMSSFFEVRWKAIEKKLPPVNGEQLPADFDPHKKAESAVLMPPSKKKKVPSVQQNVLPKPVQRIMTAEEKNRLSRELESMLAELPDSIIEFLKEHCSSGADDGDDEIEIDLDDLSDDILFQLRKLLDEFFLERQKNNAKMGEACEIELAHGSTLSNSSMQAGKGNDPVDDDVDIGGSEPPVSSCPPLNIEKDSGGKSESSSSENDFGPAKDTTTVQEESARVVDNEELAALAKPEGENPSVSGLDQQKSNSIDTDFHQDGEDASKERHISPGKQYRAALLKSRFADTILNAREKTLNQADKGDPEKLRHEREKLELQRKKEKARLQAEAKAAEEARRRADEEAAAEARRKREQEREAARQALLQMEKTVEINENSRILKDLEMLRAAPGEHAPSSVDEIIPDHSEDGLGGFMFNGINPLEQLGLFMKEDEEEEEPEPPSMPTLPPTQLDQVDEMEEGEID